MSKSYTSYTKAYNKYLNKYDKELDKYTKSINKYNSYVTPSTYDYDYSYNPNKELTNSVYEGLVKLDYNNYNNLNVDSNRSLLNRAFDVLNIGNYASAGFAMGLVDENITPFEGMMQGLVASNPFGDGHDKWEYSYSQVLEKSGWKAETLGGKLARGAVGMALDIFLDPMTYVSGGVSGLVKGTGESAAKVAIGASDDVAKGVKMTQEMAEEVIKGTKAYQNGKLTIDLATEAQELMHKYNSLIGINTKDASRTLSLANAPFGKKIFGKYADKSITLIDSDSMKALGDMTFAPMYGRLRDAVFGGKIGELFSTNHELYKLAKTKPEQVYNFMKKVDLDIGLSSGKLAMEQAIRNNAELLGNLTPAQQKEIITALEDKTVWHKVKQTVDFIDTKEASRYKKQIELSKDIANQRIDNIVDFVNKNKEELSKTNLSIEQQNKLLDIMREEYITDLINLNEKHVVELGKANQVIEEMLRANEEINPNNIKNLSTLDSELRKVNGIDPSKIVDDFKLLKTNDTKIIDDLSTYLFGQKGFISYNTLDGNLSKIINQIEEGKTVEEILNFIFNNRELYNGASKEMFNFIGDTIGYKDWDKHYTKPMNEMLETYKKHNSGAVKLSKGELAELEVNIMKLEKDNIKRELLKREFNGKTSLTDVTNHITTLKDTLGQTRTLDEIMEDLYSKGVRGSNIDETVRSNWNIEAFLDVSNDSNVRQFQKKVTTVFTLSNEQKNVAYEYYRKLYNFGDKLSVNQHKQINKTIDVLNDMLLENNVEFSSMLPSKQAQYMRNAQKKYNGMASELANKELDKLAELKKDVKKANLKSKANDALYNSVKRNQKISFMSEGKQVEGYVDKVLDIDGQKVFEVTVDGKTKQITKGLFKGKLTGTRPPSNLDDIRDVSQLYDDFVVRHNDLQDSIKEASKLFDEKQTKYLENIKEINELKVSEVNKINIANQERINEVSNLYDEMINEVNNKTLELTNKAKEYKINLSIEFDDVVDSYLKEVDKYENLLNNTSAFETYVRGLSDGDSRFVDSIINKYNPNVGKYILRDDLGFDETVKNTINQLRDEFIKFGEGEVSIGKLTQEQFDNLMYEYVPHILTKDGEEFFTKSDEVTKYLKGFGDDFGYGREFNPFEKSRKITKIPDGSGGWIENPNISQINEYFKQFTDGKNIFEENIAEVYLSRALKHNDLMYDNKYMENMLELFGEDYTGELKEGFSTVMNYGKLKQTTSDIVGVHTSLDISEAISKHIKDEDIIQKMQDKVHDMIRENPMQYKDISFKELVNKEVGMYIDDYMKNYFTPEVRHNMYLDNLNSFLKSTGTHGMLDDVATPMAQLNDKQIGSITNSFTSTKERLAKHINSKLNVEGVDIGDIEKAIRNSLDGGRLDKVDAERLERLVKKIDMFNNLKDPQIKQVNNAIVNKANQARKLQIVKDNNALLGIYDKVTHFMKLNQTAILPSFHVRNKFSNIFNNWLEIGSDAIDSDFQKKTLNAMKGNITDELFEIVSPDGTTSKIKWKDLYQAAQDYGAIDSGMFAKEVGSNMSTSKGLLSKLGVSGKFDPTNTKEFVGYTYGTKFGSVVENHDRFIHFASQVKRGMSFKDAAESVNKFLFDYSDLTMFEQNVMKRILPYYTWLRKNSQLQLEMLLEQPSKYRNISKLIGGIEGMVDDRERIDKRFVNDFAKDWVQTPFYVTNPDGMREPVLWNPNLPFMDISSIPDPSDPSGTMRDLFTQTNPLIKVPIELALNRDIFFDSPIAKEGESRLGKSAGHIARQFGIYPVAKGMVEKTGADFGLHMLNSTSGVKLLSYNYDKYKAMRISELSKKKADSNSNPGVLDSIKRKLGGY